MVNNTNLSIPKKYQRYIDEVKMDDGWYCIKSSPSMMFEHSLSRYSYNKSMRKSVKSLKNLVKADLKVLMDLDEVTPEEYKNDCKRLAIL